MALMLTFSLRSKPSFSYRTIYHLLKNPIAYEKCLEQVESVLAQKKSKISNSDSSSLWFTLDELDEMTLLYSVFWETLRLKQVIYSARIVISDFVFNPKDSRKFLVQKGTRIMACPTLVHYDPEIFDNPQQFQYDRFQDVSVTKNGKPLVNYVKPFGGGGHLCSGRKFITYETMAILAMMLSRLELRLAPEEETLANVGVDYSRQGIGVLPPTRDPILEFRRREPPC